MQGSRQSSTDTLHNLVILQKERKKGNRERKKRNKEKKKKRNSVALVHERATPTERPPLVGEVSANFADRGCRVVSVTDPYGRILGFLDRSRYYFFLVAPYLCSRGGVTVTH
jgi:hypothetical protein